MAVEKVMDHSKYLQDIKSWDIAQLYYVRDDAAKARDAMPDGINSGYYADEVHYCGMEIRRRQSI